MGKVRKQIGARRCSVTINAINEPLAADGSPSYSNGDVLATVWAAIEPLDGTETYDGAQLQASATHRITFPYSTDYSAISAKANRIVYGSRTFHIVSALNVDESNRTFELLCKEDV